MARTVIFEWESREYDHNPKNADWYWALGIVAVAGAIAVVLFGNYLFAVLIIVAAATLALHGAKHPPLHRFRIVEHGLVIGDELYPFEDMVSFSVLEDIEGEYPPLLSIKNESWLSPHLMIPLENVDAEMVYAYLLQHIDEGKHQHSVSDLVAAWLGF
jgi:hypothetical protein